MLPAHLSHHDRDPLKMNPEVCMYVRVTDHKHVRDKEFKGGICCGGHLAIMYGGDLLYLWNFLYLSPPSNFVWHELPYLRGLKSRTHVGYCAVNHTVMIMWSHWMIINHLHAWRPICPLPHGVTTGVKNETRFPFKIPWLEIVLFVYKTTNLWPRPQIVDVVSLALICKKRAKFVLVNIIFLFI